MNTATKCWNCGKPYTQDEINKKIKERQDRARKTILFCKNHNIKVGRKREHDYEKIKYHRKQGLTIRAIAKIMMCSTMTVQNAIKD